MLARNPRFHEWSPAAQPSGYPDRIILRIGLTDASAADLVAQGRADFMASFGGISRDRAYFLLHHPSQVHLNPTMITQFLFLNVTAPPLNDPRVRRAVNFALDRGRIVAADGGPNAAQPTCQLLPPRLPGFRRYCPYTRDPTSAGSWRAPDLARARQLVAASGTRGAHITVWDTEQPEQSLAEGRIAVAALKTARLPTPPCTRSPTLRISHTPATRATTRRSSTAAGAPTTRPPTTSSGNSPATTSSPPTDRPQPTKASSATRRSTNRWRTPPPSRPPTRRPRTPSGRRLDRELTDRAILLPTVTPDETDLLSRRVGNYQYNPVWGPLLDQLWVQ